MGTAQSEYLLPRDAARLLHVSAKTVNRWALGGHIPYIVTLGGHRRFRRIEVEMIGRRMVEARTAVP